MRQTPAGNAPGRRRVRSVGRPAARLSRRARQRRHRAFLIRLLFCLFAEDAGLLRPFVQHAHRAHKNKSAAFRQLFAATFGAMRRRLVRHGRNPCFRCHLFDNACALELDGAGMHTRAHQPSGLVEASSLRSSAHCSAQPRPGQTRAVGRAHRARRTSQIVEPVLMAPLRRRWTAVRAGGRWPPAATNPPPNAATGSKK